MKSIPLSFAVAAIAFGSFNCSSTTTTNGTGTGDGGGGTTPAGSRTGITPCGNFPDRIAKSCQAGQHCTDEGFSKCDTGCLTDNNCPQSATCAITGASGICQNTAPAPGTVSCDDLCKHVQACAPTVTAAQCAQLCAGYNETCKKCVLQANCSAPKTACDTQCH